MAAKAWDENASLNGLSTEVRPAVRARLNVQASIFDSQFSILNFQFAMVATQGEWFCP
jgi:hypothetical protein